MASESYQSDQDIIDAVRENRIDQRWYDYLYQSSFNSLKNFIKTNSGKDEDADDIFQEVVLAFIRSVQEGKFRGDCSIRSFLYSICRYRWLSEIARRNKRFDKEMAFFADLMGRQEHISGDLDRKEMLRQLFALLDSLGEGCKKILIYFHYAGLPMKEIALRLNYKNEDVIKAKRYKCMQKFIEAINQKPVLKSLLKSFLRHETY